MAEIFGEWYLDWTGLAEVFQTASPFPLIVIDDFLSPESLPSIVNEFPSFEDMPRSRDYVFGSKRELSSLESRGVASNALQKELCSAGFADFLSALVAASLFVDPRFHGGGFHQGESGSFLDPHVDFNVHPLHPTWLRRLNILLYLSSDWKEEYGGTLDLRNGSTGETLSISPIFNRAVIMETSSRTYHGYKKLDLPSGIARRSIATYAYQVVDAMAVKPRTTSWAPTTRGPKRLLAKYYDPLVQAKTRIFGSATARNR